MIRFVGAGTVYVIVGGSAACTASDNVMQDSTITSTSVTARAAPAGVTEAAINASSNTCASVSTIPRRVAIESEEPAAALSFPLKRSVAASTKLLTSATSVSVSSCTVFNSAMALGETP